MEVNREIRFPKMHEETRLDGLWPSFPRIVGKVLTSELRNHRGQPNQFLKTDMNICLGSGISSGGPISDDMSLRVRSSAFLLIYLKHPYHRCDIR